MGRTVMDRGEKCSVAYQPPARYLVTHGSGSAIARMTHLHEGSGDSRIAAICSESAGGTGGAYSEWRFS